MGRSHSALPQRLRERYCPATPLWRRALLGATAHLGHCYDSFFNSWKPIFTLICRSSAAIYSWYVLIPISLTCVTEIWIPNPSYAAVFFLLTSVYSESEDSMSVYMLRSGVYAGRWWATHGSVHRLSSKPGHNSCCQCFSLCPSYLFLGFVLKYPWTTSFSPCFTSVCLPFNWLAGRPSPPKVQPSCQDTNHEKEFQDLSKSVKDSGKCRQTRFCL